MATSAINTKKSISAIDTEKWETGINATVTDITEVKAFVDWRLSTYKENRWKGFDLWESFVDDFKSFTKDILNNLGKDRLKEIRDYLRENRVYTRKEARKSIADGLLKTIHEPTPLKWPVDDPTDDSADDPTDDPTPALPSLSTAPVQTTQPIATATATAITPPGTQTPTPTTPQPPAAPTPQQAAPSTQALLASPLPPTAELPLPTNVAAPPTDITASPINVTAPPTDVTAPFTNVTVPSTIALNTRPTEARATVNYGRDLVTLAKMHTEESKHNGENNNFDPAKIKGFPTTLRGIALDFYYRNKATYITFDGIG